MGLSEADWNLALSRLASCGLVSAGPRSPSVDAHPLIREHFAKRLREQSPDAWRAAHSRLYEHLTNSTEHWPDTFEGLQPLYQAVAHGCEAGMHQAARADVYRGRIQRDDIFYSWKKLGAIGADLGAMACFFEKPWSRLAPGLSEPDQAWLLNEAANRLRALGRLTEAQEPMRVALRMSIRRQGWANAAIAANNVSELELTTGNVLAALREAEQSMLFADRSGDAFLRMVMRGTVADVLHQAGQSFEARERFQETEAMQYERQPEYPLLCSLGSFRYCDLLLAGAECAAWRAQLGAASVPCSRAGAAIQCCREVEQRTAQALERDAREQWLLDIGLHHLTLGRAALYRALLTDSKAENAQALETARQEFTTAVEGLRRAGEQEFVVRGLFSRAWLRFVEGDADAARADLDEACQLAERGPMRLFLADIHLHRARLFRDAQALGQAREIITKCGYHRRDAELADAEEAAKHW